MPSRSLPYWWSWPLVIPDHAANRMEERGWTEIEVRRVLGQPRSLDQDPEPGRWRVPCRRGREHWCIIVEPEKRRRWLVMVTIIRVD